MIQVKEAHQPRDRRDGVRVLIERSWPRSLKKSEAGISLWLSALAPSPKLRRWTLGQAEPAPAKHLTLVRSASSSALAVKPMGKNARPADDAGSQISSRVRTQLFRKKYFGELAQPEAAAALQQLHRLADGARRLTLVYSAPPSRRNASPIDRAKESSSTSSSSSRAKSLSAKNSARSTLTRAKSTGTTAVARKPTPEASEFASHATALKQLLDGLPKPPGSSGPEKAAARGRNKAAMR